ncbi:MAG: lycopene cyclase family protein [Verrucomicrobiaceae bacterium]|nr:lycopene cyclase family protein [Verrucomicrobiaceae bacterium]
MILGGGCAGLSLALRLAEHGASCPSTTVIEARSKYVNDRTWCFWDDDSAKLRHLVTHRWSTVVIAHDMQKVTVDCQANPYAMIPAEAFYNYAKGGLAKTPRVTLALNERVIAEPQKEGGLWRVETNQGFHFAKWVIDTRPERLPEGGDAVLWQSFSGQEIECDAECFNPGVASLMDFSLSKSGRITFMYLLPFSTRRALIEATVFAPEPLGPEDLAGDLAAYIHRQVEGSTHVVLRSEHGVLPMGQWARAGRSDLSYVRVGVAAGGARSASGYAFQRIQGWADECAKALVAGGQPLGHAADPWIMRAMDALFLRVLRAQPGRAPELFLALFAHRDPRHIIRFMSDRAGPTDFAAIVFALPTWLFLREIPGLFHAFINTRKGRG